MTCGPLRQITTLHPACDNQDFVLWQLCLQIQQELKSLVEHTQPWISESRIISSHISSVEPLCPSNWATDKTEKHFREVGKKITQMSFVAYLLLRIESSIHFFALRLEKAKKVFSNFSALQRALWVLARWAEKRMEDCERLLGEELRGEGPCSKVCTWDSHMQWIAQLLSLILQSLRKINAQFTGNITDIDQNTLIWIDLRGTLQQGLYLGQPHAVDCSTTLSYTTVTAQNQRPVHWESNWHWSEHPHFNCCWKQFYIKGLKLRRVRVAYDLVRHKKNFGTKKLLVSFNSTPPPPPTKKIE